MKILQLFFFVLITFIITGCSSTNTVNEEEKDYPFSKINCYLRYMAQNRELQAEMTFRTDSTLAIEGEVRINEDDMVFKKLPSVGFQYRLIKNAVSFDSVYTFSYKEKDGRTEELTIKLNKFHNFRMVSDGISKKNGGLFEWEGPALKNEDGMVLVFTDSKGATFSINHTGISRGNRFELVKEYANRLSPGTATLNITRKKTVITQENDILKLLSIEFYPKAITFEVKE